ncbi:MAG: tRNA preQ1(34) S-adenosylmethionine ribosyltransferase-isomerase QueA [Armatimonadetes bacterium]|nr:tRNA preQ1(34) S-adenosylmethionine ribosyltransferase-isomerase QueA [Armatimonadota bacterium]MDW8122232.1 tRNA preQ1(34) S-adenosylmethionine ribosyltransferase-isomerase QueA [Armatimonadota bacterium]
MDITQEIKTSKLDYPLPQDRIAQRPVEPRDHSRLLVYNRNTGEMVHTFFYELSRFLKKGDVLVINDTKVIPARITARTIPTEGKVEILLLKPIDESRNLWEALVRPGRKARGGREFVCSSGSSLLKGRFEGKTDKGSYLLSLDRRTDEVLAFLEEAGDMPLPPYIHQPVTKPSDYQTVFAKDPGSVAAPTAGFHFTERLIDELKSKGILFASVTLHIGWATFKPITAETLQQHQMDVEFFRLPEETAQILRECWTRGNKVVAVGTTSVRTLESCAPAVHQVESQSGWTGLYITPGYQFKAVDALITNFHLPRSSNLALVAAFIGDIGRTLQIYQEAIHQGYRFYSFGDAMLIL